MNRMNQPFAALKNNHEDGQRNIQAKLVVAHVCEKRNFRRWKALSIQNSSVFYILNIEILITK